MEKFNNRTTRGLSYLLIYLTAIQPLHPAFAALTPDGPRTQVNNAGAVPVINIATPNAAGVSHNTYKDFSVGTPGAVLNNSIAAGQSQLAGQVNANANLNGKAADLIINEVTGSTRSDLQGKIEVFGNKANVLIANPNGITCDGCGFINTPSATLTTGKPVLDQQGALEALEVKKGSITIGGKGLDGSATDYVDILSRATELNGKINAKNLTLTQGSNRVDFKTGTIVPIAGEGAKPLLAVDTKALGGMYAERIRLVATEDGVGANVANLTSSQQGITLDSKGKIQLGNVHAKTDINLTAQQVDIAAGNTVKSDRDITLASTVLNNQGNIIAGEDMRLFNDNLTNTQATIQANNNLWIQKDATGNKGVKVENRSGTIKTNIGDLVIRTRSLNNVRDQIVVKEKKDLTYANLNVGNELPIRSLSDAKTYIPLIVKKELEGDVATSESEIHGAKNLYINATRLENNASNLKSYGNIFLAGQEFLNISPLLKQTEHTTNFRSETAQEQAIRRSNTPQSASTTILDDGIPLILAYYKVKDKESVFKGEQLLSAKVHATGNVVADFERLIKIGNVLQPTSPTVVTPDTININGNEVLLNAGDIKINGIIESSNNINLISKNQTIIDNSNLLSKNKDININSIATIASTISVLKANNVSLNSREGNIYYSTGTRPTFNDNGDRQYASLHAGDTLSLNSGGNINLSGVIFGDNTNTALTAKKDIIINNHQYDLITHKTGTGVTQNNDQERFDNTLSKLNKIFSRNSILAKAEGNLSLFGVFFNSGRDIDLIANGILTIDSKKTDEAYKKYLPSTRHPSLSSRIVSNGNLLINSGNTLSIKSANLSASNITLLAGNTLSLLSTAYSAIATPDEDNRDDRHAITQINARRNLTLATNGDLIAYGSSLSSIGDMTLSSRGKMEFNALKNYAMREGNNEFNESTTQQNVVLNSGGVLTLLSNSSILFQATSLVAKGAMDVAAKGGFLYAQAMEETNHYETESSSRTWYGKKKKGKQTYHSVSNKVAEFTAGSDISLLSRDDSIYEASKIAAGKNAKLTSTKGQVIFKAVKNTTFEQTITTSKGFFIKNSDKGYTKDTWLLPSIHAGGQFTVDAATGISADVKTHNAKSLQEALLILSNTPGATWLKGLNSRKDVQWNAVQDAYSSWNHTTQSLNPVVGAVIAIAVAAVTAGAGLAGMAATAAAGTTSGMTATVMSGAVYSGMTALTSQAAIALIDNKGNLTKTMRALGSSASVQSLVTSMAVGGALASFDHILKTGRAVVGAEKLPMLSNGDWSKVAQRVAGQSVISSSIGTAINGGSFKDNFTTALLSNIGSQINAEGAKFIGDNGSVLDVPGKALSHAVVSGIAAEISGGNVKGAAAGALAAELAGIIINDNLVKSEGWQEKQAQISRFAGAIMGAVATGKASGVNSGANAAEIVERFNRQLHLDEIQAIKELAEGNKEKEMRLLAASCRKVNCVAQESLNSEERQQYETLMALYPATREEDGILANYWVQKDRQRTSNYPLYVGYDMEQLFTYTTGDSISDGQMFARNQWIENFSQMTGWSKDTVEALGFGISIASTFAGIGKAGVGNQYLSKSLVTPTAGWKSYLVNEKTIQQTVAFKQQVTDLRAGLPSDPKRSGNVAVADINIPGIPKTLAAHSGVNVSGNGLVGKGSESFKYQEIPNNKGFIIARNTDSEYKILDNISDKLAGNISAKGTVTIFTERPACGSCLGVVEQFQQRYPGIEVKILDNNGITLRPGAKK
ncbi:DUF637 domain-containing protein [Pectobacterium aquaticum]|uniref:DUF637 domain-containing protein n=1 Tax=Pectobacterium aquaticum TaxID=2204145 RepID=UPI000E249D80|nr:DUF637 domain-containing protein [Pectobacterium aquaticum]UEM39547.1 DUF637 domain-containing protein [Pectobacterium aquaticum]